MKNILIIKLSAIGDVIHALPTAYAIKKTWPDCHLTWVVSPAAADIVKDSPAIDEVIIFDRKKLNSFSSLVKYIKPFSRELNKQHYDVSIDLQGLFKSALVAFLSHADEKIGYADMREGSSLVSRPIKGKNFNGHIIDRYLDVVQTLGCDTDNAAFPIGITEENKKNALNLLAANGIDIKTIPYVVFIIGANWANKRWPVAYFAQLASWCKEHQFAVVLAGAGNVDSESANQINDLSDNKIINIVNKTDLKELAYILKNAKAAVGGDTGNMHMAAALGRPAVMVMGPTDANRNGPYRQSQNAIEVEYDCRHCWKRKCRFDRDCLAAIKPQQVIDKLEQIVGRCPS